MGRLYCNGKMGYCERVQGTAEECENVSCIDCGFADGTGAKFIDQITNYDNIRNMSVNEMTDWMRKNIGCGRDFVPCGIVCDGKCTAKSADECREKIKQWLLQPIKSQ